MPPRTPISIQPVAGLGEADALHEHDLPKPGRRAFLKLMAASAALAGAGCSGPPKETIVPYVDMPERMVPGQPLFYASAFVRNGYAHGVLVETNMGRPTKVEGNPRHPASLGATDAFTQASILQLWDPDRSQGVFNSAQLSTGEAFETALQARRAAFERDGGAGLRILTGSISSPTMLAQLETLLARYPKAGWHSYDPLHDDAGREAAQLAFGRVVDTIYRFDRASVVLTLDADPFGSGPGATRYARDFIAARRREGTGAGCRLYALQATPTLTGALADEQLALPPAQIEQLLWRVAARLKMPGVLGEMPAPGHPLAAKWETALARQLAQARGRSLVLAGGAISAQGRALVHALNGFLGNAGRTLDYIEPVQARAVNHAQSLAALVEQMRAGAVQSLFILSANPVYNAPADLDFAAALRRVPFSVHLGLYRDETARLSSWHLAQAHAYESWSDARAYDGTASVVQPVIAPLYGGLSPHTLLAMLSGDGERDPMKLVQASWRQAGRKDAFWQDALRHGFIDGSVSAVLGRLAGRVPQPAAPQPRGLVPLFVADPSTDGGEFANNAWLQELPRPLTTLTWDNAVLLSEATARNLGVNSGDIVKLGWKSLPQSAIEAPVWVLPNHADGVLSLPLGYGRDAAGEVGNGVGFNAYRLRLSPARMQGEELVVEKTGRRHAFAVRQQHAFTEGRDIVRVVQAGQPAASRQEKSPSATLYPQWDYPDYKWGMAIDLNACIGCGTCTIACQAENNIPVVGKEEVGRGREMHWIRVDRYYEPAANGKRTLFQPVPCMHCENAPCEEVCPVGATMHDSEGLNVQVYNRCVGTRFCSNNCPYKVRRFNFLQYADNKTESLKAQRNPEVTVRRRGVMEKCNYCLQRISRARLEAEKEGRRLQDGEVVTACQAACPTGAIVFGDLNLAGSKVNAAKAAALDYLLLGELNTRPRTSYGARVINPDPELE